MSNDTPRSLPIELQPYETVARDVAERTLPPVPVTTGTKALVGGIVAAVQGAIGAGIAAFSLAVTDDVISGGEWVAIAAAIVGGSGLFGLVTGGAVYASTNKPVR